MTIDVKHFEDCEQLFMSVGHCYLIEALLEFFKMDNINELPKENNPYRISNLSALMVTVGMMIAVMIVVMGYSTMELTFCHHLCYCWIASMLWHLGMENIWH